GYGAPDGRPCGGVGPNALDRAADRLSWVKTGSQSMAEMAKRIARLEANSGDHRTVVICPDRADETSDEAIARHMAMRPADRAAGRIIVVDTGIYRSMNTR